MKFSQWIQTGNHAIVSAFMLGAVLCGSCFPSSAPAQTPASAAARQAGAAPQALPLGDVYAINAGGGSVSGYTADAYFTNGFVFANNRQTVNTASGTIPAPAAVYQDAREGQRFSYAFSGLQPGIGYAVILHFAELYWTAPYQRRFNVAINGIAKLTDFDIAETAGGPFLATDQFFQVRADASGTIRIDFTKGAVDQPTVNAIEIRGESN